MKPSKKNAKKKKKKQQQQQQQQQHKPSSSPPHPQIQTLPEAPTAAKPQPEMEEEEEETLTLAWLMDAFSPLSLDQISSAYVQSGCDAFKAAGILSAELVDPGESAEVGSGEKDCARSSRKQRKVSAAAATAATAATGTVSSVIGKGYVRKWNRSCGAGFVERKGMKERRYSVEEGEEFLCSMLGFDSELDMGVVKDVLGQCGYDVEKALDALLDISDSSNKKNKFTDIEAASACHRTEKEHEFLRHVGNSCWNYSEIYDNSGEQLPAGRRVNPDLQHKLLESLFNIPDSSKHEPSCMDWKKIVKKVESFGQGLEFTFANTEEPILNARNGKEDDYLICRSVARKHWDTMRAYYQKAAVAYSRGERVHAASLSERGKYYSKLAHEADEEASREIFEARNKDIKNTVTIDLHGQHVKQAIGLLKLHLLLFTYIPSIQFLKVITGCGVDGPGKGKLKASVLGLVVKEGIEWCEENAGTLLLRLDGLEYSFVSEDDDDPE